MVKTTKRSTAG